MIQDDAGKGRESIGSKGGDAASADDPLVLVFIPPLVSILWKLESDRGAPLSEAEVLEIRDGAVCMTMRRSMARKLVESRGHDDIDPEDAWRQWQEARRQLAREEGA